jgi:NTE family protein
MAEERSPLAVCFGGGGAFGIGFNMGVAAGLRDAGIDLRRVPMLGTSAGAYTAAALAADVGFEVVADRWEKFVTVVGRRLWVRTADLTEDLFDDTKGPGVASVALRLLSFRRTILSGDSHRLSDLVAASSSPIPLARPHRVDGRRYMDGGLRRLASADLTPAADLQLVVTPFSHPDQGLIGKRGARQARREIRRWRERVSAEVVHVAASDEIRSVRVRGMAAIGDMAIGRKVYDLALPLGQSTGDLLRQRFPSIVERLVAAEFGA